MTTLGHKLTERVECADRACRWHLLRTATRQEAKAEAALVEAGFAVYLPRMAGLRMIRRPRPHRQRVEFPMFDGYLFAGLPDGAALEDFQVDGVSGVVRFSAEREPPPLKLRMIEVILRQELAGDYDRTRANEVAPLAVGEQVMVLDGPFAGFPAQVVKLSRKDRVALLVSLFGRVMPITLPVDRCERLA